jgi:hypothetical protein
VPITTKVVTSNPVRGEVYSIQHHVIKFIRYLSHKPADDIKYDIDEIVDELIDEVIKSTEAQPSVAEVVFDTIQDVITQEGHILYHQLVCVD